MEEKQNLLFSVLVQPNTPSSGRRGFGAIYRHFSRFEFILLSSSFLPSRR
jgi:hypothetical protein